MTLNAKRRRVHEKLAALPGVRPVRRPLSPGDCERFDLYYVRTGPKSAHPLVIIPGGPGVASVQLYRGLRRRMAAVGLDVIMIEHRGVGMSRHDDSGADLPRHALTVNQVVDDVAAVLDDAQVDKAVIYGTSYGSYIAAGVGVRHPDRVHAMILDSPLLSQHDLQAVRHAIRGLLWEGTHPATAELAPKVRRLVDEGVLTPMAGQVAAVLYGYGGARLLDRQLNLLLQGRTWLWAALARGGKLAMRKVPYRNETDLVGHIGYRELNYAGEPDGLPLDPSQAMRELATAETHFEAEPYDLVNEMPKFDWPTAVVSGERDLITPRSVAERIVSLIPAAVLVGLPTAAHSIIDTRERAALAVATVVQTGDMHRLAGLGTELDELPNSPRMRLAISAIAAAAVVEDKLPALLPRVIRRAVPTS
jgi:pimeloyl-ACP methyl ester carboxylesterase